MENAVEPDVERSCPYIDFTSGIKPEDLYTTLEQLRADHGVVWTDAHGGYWVITRHADAMAVLQDWETFTSEQGVSVPRVDAPLRSLPMESDPPIQVAYRRILNPHLAPARVGLFEQEIRHIADRLIDGFISDARCELVKQFAEKVPSTVIMRLLMHGDEADIDDVHAWISNFAHEPTSEAAIVGAMNLMQYCGQLVESRQTTPGAGDIVDDIVGADIMGRPVEYLEALGMVALLFFGGFDTTASVISSAVLVLAERPALQEELRNDPSRIPASLDELLRYDPPVIGIVRRATRDTVLGGKQIKAGEAVYVSVAAANRDPSEFQNPQEVDVTRRVNRHLTFGGGPHRCVGSHLGRLMLRISLEQLLGRLDNIQLAGPVDFHQAFNRGPQHVPITFTPRQVHSA